MVQERKIKNALISVFNKDGLIPIVHKLNDLGINIYSTGGTQNFIEGEGVKVNKVEDLTTYPSILGGRVKTLHPNVFAGILSRRELNSDKEQLEKYNIPEFDLVIVDLYPFEKTVNSRASEQDIIEKIDIGGISLIRAAAKNYKDVFIVSEMSQYNEVLSVLENENGSTRLETRKKFAEKAFNISSHYDTAIFNYFNEDEICFKQSIRNSKSLRYGENPHQKGVFFGDLEDMFHQLHGKELSYNNLLDVDAAVNLISEFEDTTFAVLKHNNACGIASRDSLVDSWKDALAADPVSAFGGVLITNKEIDFETSEEINKIFFEVIIAPSYNNKALEILKRKKNRVILIQKDIKLPKTQFRTVLNGVLHQDKDLKTDNLSDMKIVTELSPNNREISDLEFASKVCKHTKSNTIVFAKNKQLLASGVGQTSRVDALKQAVIKAKSFNFDLNGAVMASDAFFPFPDCVELANNEGVKCVIQPGGSINDNLSIEFCNNNNMKMVTTGHRHFKH
ncbi:MAG: bifunctional phosphoribosylaminoimidazolecarboxamide formyltransferase/IMP cyclohydrolase PurH [Flavobacteriales bacterium]|nr:bifunctional phosphoribosylaminoimidazolecarboxamide formyltransferase/IMP cyclohydrolase PurH [Flavobacteriales bacterium]|tara:strand:- start:8281 stop:9801 length:1521 start_codon:yes stop_codon:yes gene_type:complete